MEETDIQTLINISEHKKTITFFKSPARNRRSLRGARMTHRGKRSLIKEQERIARHLAFKNAYRDKELKETVCKTTTEEIAKVMRSQPYLEMSAVPQVFHGLVLIDGYGQGALQE